MTAFVRFYASDWRSGCIGMTFEQEGLYIRICAFIFETNRRLPADDSAAAKLMGVHTNAYRKVSGQLRALGKLVMRDGEWTVDRAERAVGDARRAQGKTDVGTTRGHDGAQPQDGGAEVGERGSVPDTVVDTHHITPTDTPHITHLVTMGVFSENTNEINGASYKLISSNHRSEETPSKSPKGDVPVAEAFEIWNTEALKLGLRQAVSLSPARRRSLGARLREAGGLDGWRQAIAEIGRSKFLRGENDRGFRADLDFVLRASKFAKLRDGGYRDTDAPADQPQFWWQDAAKVAAMTPDRWRAGIAKFANGKWPLAELGFWPGHPKCLVPAPLVAELHLLEKYDDRGLAKGAWKARQQQLHQEHVQ